MNELARLRWQCRRGTKELDFLLNRYLDTGYLAADQRERELFVELLGFEDDELLTILLGEMEIPEGMKILIGKIHDFI
ncbi:FAD assembly factor SdhE [Methylobacter sp.]|uniref:FAD assembly factor SdhE n=1 Tax=Methylobacter sp. TaxID=2051955 RepID=UPI002FDD713F